MPLELRVTLGWTWETYLGQVISSSARVRGDDPPESLNCWAIRNFGLMYPTFLNYYIPNTQLSKTKQNKKTISNTKQINKTVPKINTVKDTLHITHREYVNPVDLYNSSIGYSIADAGSPTNSGYSSTRPYKYSINPGDGAVFPWLSGIAARFEKYQFKNITIHYKPSCPTTTPGGLALVANYDPSDSVPVSRSELFNLESVARAAVYDEMQLKIKNSALSSWRYVRTTNSAGVDPFELRTMDAGYWCSCLTNTTADIQFGDLYVSYSIELKGPKLSGSTAKCSHHHFIVDTRDRASFDGNTVQNVPFALTNAEGQQFLSYEPTPYTRPLVLKAADIGKEDEHYQHSTSTLKTSWFHNGQEGWELDGFGYPGGMTQMRFDEPFSGIMHVQTNVLDGVAGGGVPRVNAVTRPAGEDLVRPRAGVAMIQGPAATDTRLTTYSVKANAGEWLDWGFNATGTALQWAGDIAATFAEVAPDLIAAGQILGLLL